MICQFRPTNSDHILSEFIDIPDVYPAGRLDKDSEGLLLLTDHGGLQHRITQPTHKMPKGYWVQVEGEVDADAVAELSRGLALKDGVTKPAVVKQISEPHIWDRDPPIRKRKSIPTSWLDITLYEGRNRQIRRMCLAVGHRVAKLRRVRFGPLELGRLAPGEHRPLTRDEVERLRQAAGAAGQGRGRRQARVDRL